MADRSDSALAAWSDPLAIIAPPSPMRQALGGMATALAVMIGMVIATGGVSAAVRDENGAGPIGQAGTIRSAAETSATLDAGLRVATVTDAASTGGTPLPTAAEIWRHLPGQPARGAKPQRPSGGEASTDSARPPMADVSEAAAASQDTSISQGPLAAARIVIHASDDVQQLALRLREAGAGEVETRRVPFRMSAQSIRYFYRADQAMSESVRSILAADGRTKLDDFTHYAPLPRRGTIEIWMP